MPDADLSLAILMLLIVFGAGCIIGSQLEKDSPKKIKDYHNILRQRNEANSQLAEKDKVIENMLNEIKLLQEQRNTIQHDYTNSIIETDKYKRRFSERDKEYHDLYTQSEDTIRVLSKRLEEAKETHSSIRRKLREELDAEYKERLDREADSYNNQVRYTNTLLTKISELQTELAKYTAASERAAVIRRVKTRESKVS